MRITHARKKSFLQREDLQRTSVLPAHVAASRHRSRQFTAHPNVGTTIPRSGGSADITPRGIHNVSPTSLTSLRSSSATPVDDNEPSPSAPLNNPSVEQLPPSSGLMGEGDSVAARPHEGDAAAICARECNGPRRSSQSSSAGGLAQFETSALMDGSLVGKPQPQQNCGGQSVASSIGVFPNNELPLAAASSNYDDRSGAASVPSLGNSLVESAMRCVRTPPPSTPNGAQ